MPLIILTPLSRISIFSLTSNLYLGTLIWEGLVKFTFINSLFQYIFVGIYFTLVRRYRVINRNICISITFQWETELFKEINNQINLLLPTGIKSMMERSNQKKKKKNQWLLQKAFLIHLDLSHNFLSALHIFQVS